MAARIEQRDEQAAGFATLHLSGTAPAGGGALRLSVASPGGGGMVWLDPSKSGAAAWSTAETWFDVSPASEPGSDLSVDLGPAITWHLEPFKPYALGLRAGDGPVQNERLSWISMRLPSTPPPVLAPEVEPVAEPEPDPLEAFAGMAEAEPVSESEPGTPTREAARRGGIVWWPIVAAAVLVAVGAAAWFFLSGDPEEAQVAETPAAEAAPDPEPASPAAAAAPEAAGVPLTVDGARAYLRDAAPTPAEALAEAQRFTEAGHHAAAFLLVKHAARGGSAQAALDMGRYYDPASHDAALGVVAQPDALTAADWFERAAKGGNVPAMSRLGEMLQSGETNVPDAPEQAVFWLRKAAEAGDTKAQELLQK